MAWFFFYRKWDDRQGKFVFDEEMKIRDDILEEEWRRTRGQNVPVIDDMTGNSLSKREIQELEDERNEMMTPKILIPDDEGVIQRKPPKRLGRKYKPRKTISKELRIAVYQLYHSRCARCQTDKANQIHHMDGDPSNNNILNLQLLCYNCHLEVEGKELFNGH